jgi:peptidoglycan hydrolase CwlO-like protein
MKAIKPGTRGAKQRAIKHLLRDVSNLQASIDRLEMRCDGLRSAMSHFVDKMASMSKEIRYTEQRVDKMEGK